MLIPLNIFPWFDATLALDLEPPSGDWKLVDQKPNLGSVTYESNMYILDLVQKRDGTAVTMDFSLRRSDDEKFSVQRYSISCILPIIDMSLVWHASVRPRDFTNVVLPWSTTVQSSANNGMPYVACSNRSGQNRLAVGFVNQLLETKIQANFYNHQKGLYQLKMSRPCGSVLKRRELNDSIFFSDQASSWFDVVASYTNWVDSQRNYKPNPIPKYASHPTWCSWFCHMDDINENNIWENSKLAKEVGIKTILIDAGWFAPSGRWGSLDSSAGDWIPDPDKFPDFRGLIHRIQEELGLLVQLWVSAFWIGTGSKAFRDLKHARIVQEPSIERQENGIGYLSGLADDADVAWREELAHGLGVPEIYLCPRHPATKKHVEGVIRHIISDYGVDGIWFDFMDTIPTECNADHEHVYETTGEAYVDCLKAMYEAAVQINPEVIFEIKQGYGNLAGKPYANILQASSGAHDFDKMRRLVVLQRSWGTGTLIKCGTPIWHVDERDSNVAKYMSAAIIAGAPSLSVDFRYLPPSHMQIVQKWLRFYELHKKDLLAGRFKPLNSTGELYQDLIVEGNESGFLYLSSQPAFIVGLEKPKNELYIMNSTYGDRLLLKVRGLEPGIYDIASLDCHLNHYDSGSVEIAGELVLDQPCPEGGMLHLKKRR